MNPVSADRNQRSGPEGVDVGDRRKAGRGPSAIQADLLPFDYPPGQGRRTLGPRTQWRLETILNLDPIAASTGLPLWHHAAADCLRYQRLGHPERGQKVLAECAANLVKSGKYTQIKDAYADVLGEYQDALRTILGFEGLPWPEAARTPLRQLQPHHTKTRLPRTGHSL